MTASRPAGGVTGAVVPGLAALLLVTACSGSSSAPGSSAGGSPTGAPSAPGAASSAATPGPSGPSGSSGSPSASALAPVPARSRATLPPAPASRPVTVAGRARVAVAGVRDLTVTGQGPGELSGHALALTLRVTNAGSSALDLGAVTVTASVRGQEASPSEAAPSRPLSGAVAAGAGASGVYVFVLPAAARRPVALVVSLAPDLPVARFTLR